MIATSSMRTGFDACTQMHAGGRQTNQDQWGRSSVRPSRGHGREVLGPLCFCRLRHRKDGLTAIRPSPAFQQKHSSEQMKRRLLTRRSPSPQLPEHSFHRPLATHNLAEGRSDGRCGSQYADLVPSLLVPFCSPSSIHRAGHSRLRDRHDDLQDDHHDGPEQKSRVLRSKRRAPLPLTSLESDSSCTSSQKVGISLTYRPESETHGA